VSVPPTSCHLSFEFIPFLSVPYDSASHRLLQNFSDIPKPSLRLKHLPLFDPVPVHHRPYREWHIHHYSAHDETLPLECLQESIHSVLFEHYLPVARHRTLCKSLLARCTKRLNELLPLAYVQRGVRGPSLLVATRFHECSTGPCSASYTVAANDVMGRCRRSFIIRSPCLK
jgi:hypothetical protein